MTGKISEDPDRVVNGTEKFAAAVGGSNFGVLGSSIATYLASLAQTLTNKAIDAANNTISNLTTSMFAANVVDVDGAFTANSDMRIPSQKAVKTATDAISTTLSSGLSGKVSTNAIDTDSAFAANSDSKIPSQKAVKTAMDALVVGSGGVAGPGASTDSGFARWNGTSGSTLKNSAATVALGSEVSGTLPVANGGTGDTGSAWSTWSPTVTSGSGTITTLGTVTARYKQIGKTVFFSLVINITTNGTGASNINFTLPVTGNATGCFSGAELAVSGKLMSVFMNTTTAGRAIFYDGTYPGANGAKLVINGTYETN